MHLLCLKSLSLVILLFDVPKIFCQVKKKIKVQTWTENARNDKNFFGTHSKCFHNILDRADGHDYGIHSFYHPPYSDNVNFSHFVFILSVFRLNFYLKKQILEHLIGLLLSIISTYCMLGFTYQINE